MQLIQLFDCHRIGYIPLMFRFVMRVDEQRICHSILANSANQILVCFYWLNGGTGQGGGVGWWGSSFHSRQTLSTNSFVGFKSITASTFRSCLWHLSLSLPLSLSLYPPTLCPSTLLLSHLTFLQGQSKMTRNVARQDRFFPSGQNTTRFKLETLSLARNHTYLDGSPASLSKTHSYCNALTAVLKILWFLRIHRQEGNCKYKFNISDVLFFQFPFVSIRILTAYTYSITLCSKFQRPDSWLQRVYDFVHEKI